MGGRPYLGIQLISLWNYLLRIISSGIYFIFELFSPQFPAWFKLVKHMYLICNHSKQKLFKIVGKLEWPVCHWAAERASWCFLTSEDVTRRCHQKMPPEDVTRKCHQNMTPKYVTSRCHQIFLSDSTTAPDITRAGCYHIKTGAGSNWRWRCWTLFFSNHAGRCSFLKCVFSLLTSPPLLVANSSSSHLDKLSADWSNTTLYIAHLSLQQIWFLIFRLNFPSLDDANTKTTLWNFMCLNLSKCE